MAIIEGSFESELLGGGDEDDQIMAQEGDDRLNGRRGDDTLLGGMGDDLLFGKRGADLLKDGWGEDTLVGGVGADTFEFVRLETGVTGRQRDIVRDFQDDIDTLDLRAVANDFDDLRITDMANGNVRIRVGERVIILRDKDDTLLADDLTADDFTFGL